MPQATPQEKVDAEAALEKYETLAGASQRQRFLRTFQEHGPGNLRWVMSFSASISDVDTTTKSVMENYMSLRRSSKPMEGASWSLTQRKLH